jgi:hypothetical protein
MIGTITEYIDEYYPDEHIILFDGLEDAFIGIGWRFCNAYACYSKDLIIKILMDRDCMTYDEAIEYFDYNIAGMELGEYTPVIVETV